jgi:hypothetical protein
MAFDSLKKMFGIGARPQNAEPEQGHKKVIDSEIDSLERDIQEYIEYTDSRKKEAIGSAPASPVPEKFSQGGATTTAVKLKK